jgi:hypothetical protein
MKTQAVRNYTGFNKTKYNAVNYDSSKYILKKDDFVTLLYGVDPTNLRPVIGKVKEVKEMGVWVFTDYGWMHPSFDRISKIFVERGKNSPVIVEAVAKSVQKALDRVNKPKKQRGIKPAETVNGGKSVKVLSGIVDKYLTRVRAELPKITVSEDKTDTASKFSRTVTFSCNGKTVILTIASQDSIQIDITGSVIKRHAKLRPSSSGKIMPHQSYLCMSRIKSLLK